MLTAVEQARRDTDTAPTPAQIEAGNYRKGRFNWNGLTIAIETPRGESRSGVGEDGKPWTRVLRHDYGEVSRVSGATSPTGADDDKVDVFVGSELESPLVFIVNQCDKDGAFDEHKCMIGFRSLPDAARAYLSNYAAGWKLGPVSTLSVEEFKEWLKDGNTKKALPGVEFQKAHVDRPGSRGGRFYITHGGKVRYGKAPLNKRGLASDLTPTEQRVLDATTHAVTAAEVAAVTSVSAALTILNRLEQRGFVHRQVVRPVSGKPTSYWTRVKPAAGPFDPPPRPEPPPYQYTGDPQRFLSMEFDEDAFMLEDTPFRRKWTEEWKRAKADWTHYLVEHGPVYKLNGDRPRWYLLSHDLETRGLWRVTQFADDGPIGHEVGKTPDEALSNAAYDIEKVQAIPAAEFEELTRTPKFVNGSRRVGLIRDINALSFYAGSKETSQEASEEIMESWRTLNSWSGDDLDGAEKFSRAALKRAKELLGKAWAWFKGEGDIKNNPQNHLGVDKRGHIHWRNPNLSGAQRRRPDVNDRKPVEHPGSRGGRYWVDSVGRIRYGERPEFETEQHFDPTEHRARARVYFEAAERERAHAAAHTLPWMQAHELDEARALERHGRLHQFASGDLPRIPYADLADFEAEHPRARAAVSAAASQLLREHVLHNRHLHVSWPGVRIAAARVIEDVTSHLDLAGAYHRLSALGKKHGAVFLAYAVAIEVFEDVLLPAFLAAIGKAYLIPVALTFRTTPVLYPLYFAVARRMLVPAMASA